MKKKIKKYEGPMITLTTKGKKLLVDYRKFNELYNQFIDDDETSLIYKDNGPGYIASMLHEIFRNEDIVSQSRINDSDELSEAATDPDVVYYLYEYMKPCN